MALLVSLKSVFYGSFFIFLMVVDLVGVGSSLIVLFDWKSIGILWTV